jgi:CheY-like chemotaxis protein/predicted transcriptional regulator
MLITLLKISSAMRENCSGTSFSIIVIKRILDALGDSGVKKTNLAAKTGLNYPNCVRYIELLKVLGWVRTSDDGANFVSLTEHGVYFRSILTKMSRPSGDSTLSDFVNGAGLANGQVGKVVESVKPVYNVLLVDDEPDVLLTYKMFLTRQGFKVEAFPEAKSALQHIASVGPSYYDLVITDIRMKPVNGLQLYRGVRSIDPDVKVIFVSALDAAEELVSVFPGITSKDILRKPVDWQEVVGAVYEALKEARLSNSGRLAPTPLS